ncbi:MAG: transcriptional regulator, partial [Propionibacteriaceae bacterium]
ALRDLRSTVLAVDADRSACPDASSKGCC